jgi:hypothetical protein
VTSIASCSGSFSDVNSQPSSSSCRVNISEHLGSSTDALPGIAVDSLASRALRVEWRERDQYKFLGKDSSLELDIFHEVEQETEVSIVFRSKTMIIACKYLISFRTQDIYI